MLNSQRRPGLTAKALTALSSALVLAGPLAGAAHADAMGPGLATVEAALRDAGPRATLARYFDCAQPKGNGYEAVAQGSRQWLALAEKLMRHADACYTQGLQHALGQAMQRVPREVLPLVGRSTTLTAELICLPIISDEIAPAAQTAAVARSRRAIEAVRDETLRPQRQACLQFIGVVEAGIASRQPAPRAASASEPARPGEAAAAASRRARAP